MATFDDVVDLLNTRFVRVEEELFKKISAAILGESARIEQIKPGVYDVKIFDFTWDPKYDSILCPMGISNIERKKAEDIRDESYISFRLTKIKA